MQGSGAPFPNVEQFPDFVIAARLFHHNIEVTFAISLCEWNSYFEVFLTGVTNGIFHASVLNRHYSRKLAQTQPLLSEAVRAVHDAIIA